MFSCDGLLADEAEIDKFLDAYPKIRKKYDKFPDLKQKIQRKLYAKRRFSTPIRNNLQENITSQNEIKVPLN